jgi:hypothetical protein
MDGPFVGVGICCDALVWKCAKSWKNKVQG